MQSEKQVDKSIIFFLPQLYCSNSFRNRKCLGVCLFFQLKGGTGRGGWVCSFVIVSFWAFQILSWGSWSPPPSDIFKVTRFTSLIKRVGGQRLHAPYTAVLFFCLMCKCARKRTLVVLSVLWQNSWRYTFKKNKKIKKLKNKGLMAINSFKKTMENNA